MLSNAVPAYCHNKNSISVKLKQHFVILKQDSMIVTYYLKSYLCRFSKEDIVFTINYIKQSQSVLLMPQLCLDMIKLFAR